MIWNGPNEGHQTRKNLIWSSAFSQGVDAVAVQVDGADEHVQTFAQRFLVVPGEALLLVVAPYEYLLQQRPLGPERLGLAGGVLHRLVVDVARRFDLLRHEALDDQCPDDRVAQHGQRVLDRLAEGLVLLPVVPGLYCPLHKLVILELVAHLGLDELVFFGEDGGVVARRGGDHV